jgi:ArsR family transcriptional regulator
LAHPVRVQILRILLDRSDCYCGDLCAEFTLAQSTVSQHLKMLREAGLIRGNPRGTAVCYCAEPERLNSYRDWASALSGASLQLTAFGAAS